MCTGSPGPREHRITAARPHGDVRLEHGLEEPAQQAAVVDGLLGLHVDELHVAAEALAHVCFTRHGRIRSFSVALGPRADAPA